VDLPLRVPASLTMRSDDGVSRSFWLVCVEGAEGIGSSMGNDRSRVSMLSSALCTAEGQKIELSDEDVVKALVNWLSPQRDEFYMLSFWPLLLLLACVSFILFLVISSGRCFEHQR
jgi:hypothetical protein